MEALSDGQRRVKDSPLTKVLNDYRTKLKEREKEYGLRTCGEESIEANGSD